MAIVNGVGYDPWASKLIAANPVHGRVVLTVGDVVGVKPGGNPHRWYSPANVQQVISAIVRDYSTARSEGRGVLRARRRRSFETTGLAEYKKLIATIKRRFGGTPVGASESIFAPLAQALGLKLITPASFLKAISEGTEPTAADKTTIDRQIAKKQIKVWVFNSQNSTPDVAAPHRRRAEAGHPDHDDHRDAHAGVGDVPAVAGRASCRRSCSRWRKAYGRDGRHVRGRRGAHRRDDDLARRLAHRGARRVRRGARGRTDPASRR